MDRISNYRRRLSMLENKKKYEKEVIKLFLEILKKYQKKFIEKGISFDEPELVLIKEIDDCYTSEIRTYFYIHRELVGIIEFFIFYKGKSKATLLEFQEWFHNEIDYILHKAEKIT